MRASFCLGVKLGVVFRGCSEFVSFLTLSRYSSISTEAVGDVHVLFSLKGCGSVGDLFWKKYLILLFLSNSSSLRLGSIGYKGQAKGEDFQV